MFLLSAPAARAVVVARVSDEALAPMRNPAARHIRIDGLPIYDSARSVIELEEFEVWAPGAKVVVHSPEGVTEMDPPATRFFRGLVNDDAESFAYFAVDQQTKRVDGLIVTRDKRFALRSDVRPASALHPARPGEVQFDQFLTEIDGEELNAEGTMRSWECAVDRMKMRAPEEPEHAVNVTADGKAVSQGITGSQSYAITIKIETDFELYQNAGSNVTTLTNYVTNLTGALATIYMRDLNIEVTQSMLAIYTTEGVDPWESTDANNGLDELGDEYHLNVLNGTTGIPNNRTSSAVMLLSGVDYGGGIAWEGVICGNDFFQGGHWGGPYGWSGGIGKLFSVQGLGTVPNPDATVSGVQYGMPSGTQNYWPLAEYTHELGHNLGGHHTHCTQVTAGEFSASGFVSGELTVDHCYGHEDFNGIGTAPDFPACFNGNDYQAGAQGVFKGTIMSYCHNIFVGGVPQSRFTFGLPSEPSHHQLDDYMLRAGGPVQVVAPATDDGTDGGARNIVNGVGSFTMTVSAPASVAPSSTGNAASVVASPSTGATYVWSVSNGTLTSGQGTTAITFTAGASGDVVVKATAYNDKRCGVTESKSVPVTAATYDPPTGVVATATSTSSVVVTWNPVAGAVDYRLWRTSDTTIYEQIGSATPNLTMTDTTAVPNMAYLYLVDAGETGNYSFLSAPSLATTIMFTDPALTVGSTRVKQIHFDELLEAVNMVRELAGVSAITFSAPAPGSGVTVRAAHLENLRTGLNGALAFMAMPQISFTDPTITAGSTAVKAVHIDELRAGLQ